MFDRYEEEEEEDEDENGDDGEKDDLEGIFDESGDEGGDDKLEEDEEEEADEDEDEEDPEQHARLLSAVRGRGGEEEDGSFHVPAAAEGEFAVGSTAGSLSLQSLVGALQRNNNKLVQKGVTKELSKLAAKGAVLVPAAPVVTARAMREAGYEEASKAVSAWQPLVKQNRQKEQLKFPLNDPGAALSELPLSHARAESYATRWPELRCAVLSATVCAMLCEALASWCDACAVLSVRVLRCLCGYTLACGAMIVRH